MFNRLSIAETTMCDIATNLRRVHADIGQACARCRRDPASVTLVAVSKFHPVEAIVEAYDAGQRDFSENYAQDFAAKREQLLERCPEIRLHFIGPLQSNIFFKLMEERYVERKDTIMTTNIPYARASTRRQCPP